MDDNSKKLGQLFWKLNAGEVSAELLPQLLQLCAAIDAANWMVASGIQVSFHKRKIQVIVVNSNRDGCGVVLVNNVAGTRTHNEELDCDELAVQDHFLQHDYSADR